MIIDAKDKVGVWYQACILDVTVMEIVKPVQETSVVVEVIHLICLHKTDHFPLNSDAIFSYHL
jgi:hypothetical protein